MTARFIHLRVHTEFSLSDGLVRIKPLISAIGSAGLPAVAVTDQSNLCSLVKFYSGAMGAGIKPVCGADLWVENPADKYVPSRIVLLCMNEQGYHNLTELISRAFLENQHHEKALVKREWIMARSEGLIGLSGAKDGEIGRALLAGRKPLAGELLQEWMQAFADRFYLELHRTNRAGDEGVLRLNNVQPMRWKRLLPRLVYLTWHR